MERIDAPGWRKSSFSGGSESACVEVAHDASHILVRDTKDHGRGSIHRYTQSEWRAFVAKMRGVDSVC
jgi:hypothetical protein